MYSIALYLPKLFEVLHELFPGGDEARIDTGYVDIIRVAVHVELLIETFHKAADPEFGGTVADGAPERDDTWAREIGCN